VLELLRRSSPASRAVAAGLLAMGLVIGVVVVAGQTGSVTGLLDLRIYRGAALELRHGASIYDYRFPGWNLGSTYPPFASVLFLVLTVGGQSLVEYLFTVVNIVLWWAIFAALMATRPPTSAGRTGLARAGALALVTIGSVGVWNTLNQGQVNIIVWFALLGDLILVVRRHPAAGVLTGVAGGVKLVPLVILGLYLLCGRWRAAAQGAAAFAVCTLVGLAVAPAESWRYWTQLLFDTSRIGWVGDRQNNSLRFLLAQAGLGDDVAQVVWVVLALAVAALAVRALRPALDRGAVVTAATLIGCASALISPISWMHHLVFLAFPLVLLLPEPGSPRRAVLARLALLAVAVVVLVDPLGGNGRDHATSTLRGLTMVALLAVGPALVEVEAGRRHRDGTGEPGGVPGATPGGGATMEAEAGDSGPLSGPTLVVD
jgi:alpha-1,2-mannosyltransferase